MVVRLNSPLVQALKMVAPGSTLRDGLDRVLQAKMGALIVVGDGPDVLAVCSGGFLLDAEYSPQRLSELAKMDGAIILASDASRIARANVHLLPDPGVPTTETGTRHRTAERVARSIDVPVISVSEEMSIIAVYRQSDKVQLQGIGEALDRAGQAIQTLERYRSRLDQVLALLSLHEIDGTVTVRDVAVAYQRLEMVHRVSEELGGQLVSLGDEGRHVELQLDELLAGLDRERTLLCRDYAIDPDVSGRSLAKLDSHELLDLGQVGRVLGLADSSGTGSGAAGSRLVPKGYRLLSRVPRLSDPVIAHVATHFSGVPDLLMATVAALTRVDGVGEVRARAIRDGLSRASETILSEARGR
jgi:diadenylate cyclase